MKTNKIRLEGRQVFGNEDELDDGNIEIEVSASYILDELDNKDIEDYARWTLDMKHEDDFESNLDDFSESELVDHLRGEWFNFIDEVEEEDMIEYLENRGYVISGEGVNSSEYDYVDMCLFDDITSVFDSLSCAKRQELRDIVINNFK